MVKIVIRFGILIVVLVAIYLAFNLFVSRPMADDIAKAEQSKAFTATIENGLDRMLSYEERWPDILSAQRRDIEFVRTVLPEAPFNEKVFLTLLLNIFSRSEVKSKGMAIRPARAASTQVNFFSFISADLGELAGNIQKFQTAFDYLNGTDKIAGKDQKRFDSLTVDPGSSAEELELALWYSYQFNNKMAINVPTDKALEPGFEIHRFDTTITGSYDNIKRFIWMIHNMRPHTIIVNWHLVPGKGIGEKREYTATMTLVTFADTNKPPVYDTNPDNPDMPDIQPLLSAIGVG